MLAAAAKFTSVGEFNSGRDPLDNVPVEVWMAGAALATVAFVVCIVIFFRIRKSIREEYLVQE